MNMNIKFNRREVLLILRALDHESLICWEKGLDQLTEEFYNLYTRIYNNEGVEQE